VAFRIHHKEHFAGTTNSLPAILRTAIVIVVSLNTPGVSEYLNGVREANAMFGNILPFLLRVPRKFHISHPYFTTI
jgi:hypothetical protein